MQWDEQARREDRFKRRLRKVVYNAPKSPVSKLEEEGLAELEQEILQRSARLRLQAQSGTWGGTGVLASAQQQLESSDRLGREETSIRDRPLPPSKALEASLGAAALGPGPSADASDRPSTSTPCSRGDRRQRKCRIAGMGLGSPSEEEPDEMLPTPAHRFALHQDISQEAQSAGRNRGSSAGGVKLVLRQAMQLVIAVPPDELAAEKLAVQGPNLEHCRLTWGCASVHAEGDPSRGVTYVLRLCTPENSYEPIDVSLRLTPDEFAAASGRSHAETALELAFDTMSRGILVQPPTGGAVDAQDRDGAYALMFHAHVPEVRERLLAAAAPGGTPTMRESGAESKVSDPATAGGDAAVKCQASIPVFQALSAGHAGDRQNRMGRAAEPAAEDLIRVSSVSVRATAKRVAGGELHVSIRPDSPSADSDSGGMIPQEPLAVSVKAPLLVAVDDDAFTHFAHATIRSLRILLAHHGQEHDSSSGARWRLVAAGA